MSSPTSGSDPNYPQGGAPQGEPGWGAPQTPDQGYNPAPSYSGPPAGYGAAGGAGARPQQVLIAAILGFVAAVLLLLAAFAYFALSSLVGFLAIFAILFLALTAAHIWGGVLAIQGKGSQILLIAAAVAGGLALLGIIIALVNGAGFDTFSLLVLLLAGGIVFLLVQPQSKAYFASRGTK